MWNTNSMTVHSQDEQDESWEVKAFAQDTENAMGTTWPPRSYTCTFCRREFRSAQALGGHMNVHRRDRARLHQAQPIFRNPNLSSSSTQELVPDTTAGLCLLFALPKPNPSFKPSSSLSNVNGGTSSHLHSNTGNFMNFPAVVAPHTPNFPAVVDSNSNQRFSLEDTIKKTDLAVDGVDLELRLGCSSSSSSS